jgi:hypothetical protein
MNNEILQWNRDIHLILCGDARRSRVEIDIFTRHLEALAMLVSRLHHRLSTIVLL